MSRRHVIGTVFVGRRVVTRTNGGADTESLRRCVCLVAWVISVEVFSSSTGCFVVLVYPRLEVSCLFLVDCILVCVCHHRQSPERNIASA